MPPEVLVQTKPIQPPRLDSLPERTDLLSTAAVLEYGAHRASRTHGRRAALSPEQLARHSAGAANLCAALVRMKTPVGFTPLSPSSPRTPLLGPAPGFDPEGEEHFPPIAIFGHRPSGVSPRCRDEGTPASSAAASVTAVAPSSIFDAARSSSAPPSPVTRPSSRQGSDQTVSPRSASPASTERAFAHPSSARSMSSSSASDSYFPPPDTTLHPAFAPVSGTTPGSSAPPSTSSLRATPSEFPFAGPIRLLNDGAEPLYRSALASSFTPPAGFDPRSALSASRRRADAPSLTELLVENGPPNVLEYRSLREARPRKSATSKKGSSSVASSVSAAQAAKKAGPKRQFGELDVQMIVNKADVALSFEHTMQPPSFGYAKNA